MYIRERIDKKNKIPALVNYGFDPKNCQEYPIFRNRGGTFLDAYINLKATLFSINYLLKRGFNL